MPTRILLAIAFLLAPHHAAEALALEAPRSGRLYFGWASVSIRIVCS